jgi:hypothetical protein
MSNDGTTIAIGAPFNEGNGFWSGQIRVYKYTPPQQQDCAVSWNLYNSRTDTVVMSLVNNTNIRNPPPCGYANIEALGSCAKSKSVVVLELYDHKGTLVQRRTELQSKYFVYGNRGPQVHDGIRAIVDGTPSSYTKFTILGSCK